jgi:twitching motility protein PilT
MAKIDMFLKKAIEIGASDFHISTNSPPVYRVMGEIKRLPYQNLTLDITKALIAEILPEKLKDQFIRNGHIDFAYDIPGVGRFRTNVFRSHNGLDASFRVIPNKIPTLQELNLPQTLSRITQYHQGIVLITGPTGHGKTTTMASLINMISQSRPHHIITIEQPVEYVFSSLT